MSNFDWDGVRKDYYFQSVDGYYLSNILQRNDSIFDIRNNFLKKSSDNKTIRNFLLKVSQNHLTKKI